MKTESRWTAVRIALVIVMLFLLFWNGINETSVSIATNIIIVVVIISFLRYRYPERYQKDERTKKLSSYAASWSWLITLVIIALLFWINYLGIIELIATQVLGIVLFVMIITMIAFYWYFNRIGDVE